MDKNYPEKLGEWVKHKAVTKRNKALVSFLTVRNDVTSALDVGYSIKTVWSHMVESKRIDFSDQTFLKFVNHQIRRKRQFLPLLAQCGDDLSALADCQICAGT